MRTPVFHALAPPILSLIVLSNYGHHLCSRTLPGDCLLQCTALPTFSAIQPTYGSQGVWCGTPVLGPWLPLYLFHAKSVEVTFSRDNWNSELSLALPIHSCSTGPLPWSLKQNSSTFHTTLITGYPLPILAPLLCSNTFPEKPFSSPFWPSLPCWRPDVLCSQEPNPCLLHHPLPGRLHKAGWFLKTRHWIIRMAPCIKEVISFWSEPMNAE